MMDYRTDPLWLKLGMMNAQGLQAMAPLMQAIEQQMGSNAEMAQRVIEEYRKFLFLAMRAGHQVIPPGPINDVWMAHLQYAQNYWENLGQMLGDRPAAPASDAKRFASMAEAWTQTLQSYETVFGTKPPMDIWGQGPASGPNPWAQAMQNMRRMFGLE
jgi:hypothetical protein